MVCALLTLFDLESSKHRRVNKNVNAFLKMNIKSICLVLTILYSDTEEIKRKLYYQ